MASPIALDISGPIGTITLSDPDRGNSLDLAMGRALLAAIHDCDRAGVAVIALRAQGRFFCVGGDIAGFAAEAEDNYFDDLTNVLHRCISRLARTDAIVLSVVSGPAAGAGLGIAAAADIVLAARSATFTFAYTRIGLTPDGGSTAVLPASIGLHRSLYLALLNPRLSAEQAYAAGLVAEVVDDDALAARAEELIAQLAAGPHAAQAATKHLLRQSMTHAPETQMELESLSIIRAAATADGTEGVAAFLEKRQPRFGR
jgi:2-(1,2-epoxy-1,2-dihydrophenyl)acetyl-CoA isomerase